ncbi:MAG: ATP-dependent RNA helicase HrpA [Deltaproteobacteria bacterium]|nr:ATP-dependent RNA helicase HrpA [Deltaproteobacteria bacterium]
MTGQEFSNSKSKMALSDIKSLQKRIRSGVRRALHQDRRLITGELRLISNAIEKGEDGEGTLAKLLKLEKRLNASIKKREARRNHLPEITYPGILPITKKKDEIIEAIKNHQVVVITGETGSGKTTQIPKMCIEARRGIDGIIGCTQPRRIAAVTVAHRIADELKEDVGRSVGYKIRFRDKTNKDTHIKLMTDGILLMETQSDPYLNRYDTLIIDEAHERSTNIDFLLGILKRLLGRRRDLKLIITSATIDPEKFSKAFDNAPIIEVSGRMYPVEVRYRPIDSKMGEEGETSHVDAAVRAVDELSREEPGDILIFMPTQQDIVDTCAILAASKNGDSTVLPLFGRLSSSQQQRVFARTRMRKIVVATNVAETSITIPGIRYVIDTGLARISEYNPGTRTRKLPIKVISRSNAIQRTGRCGRVQDGVCVRLYTEEDYEKRPLFTTPEILRSNLAEVILRMIALGMGNISSFPFIDAPSPGNIRDGFALLRELGATRSEGRKIFLTDRGTAMSRLPLDPRISRMIIDAERYECVEEVIIIASALSIADPRERPLEKEQNADRMHKPFVNTASDFITLLNIWNRYHDIRKELKTQNRMRRFCTEHFLSYRRMREWRDVYEQISNILKETGHRKTRKTLQGELLYEGIHKAILGGYISSIGVKKEKNIYLMAKGKEVMIFPGSGLFNHGGDWIVSAEIVETSRIFARINAVINPEWLEEIGGDLCRRNYLEAHWEKNRGEVVASEQVKLYGLIIVPGRPVSYGRIDPVEATKIFIRSALVEGDIREPLPFLIHNRDLIEEVAGMEDKLRRRNILANEDVLTEFYEKRVGIACNIRTLKKLIKDRGTDDFLRMSREDIMEHHPKEELSMYPNEITLGNMVLSCSYSFDPGGQDDGVTIHVPSDIASTLPLESADWRIPALLREKITALIKGLPKEYRKKLVPIPQTVNTMIHNIKSSDSSLLTSMAQFIHEKFNINIPAAAWPIESIPDYLKMRFSVVNEKGEEIRSGRDIHLLHKDIPDGGESPAFKTAKKQWERDGITSWDFEDLPEDIALKGKDGADGLAYPALEREADGNIAIRLFRDMGKAAMTHKKGIAALYEIHFRKDMKFLKKCFILPQEIKKGANYRGGARQIESSLYLKTIRTLFERNIRKREDFLEYAKSAGRDILPEGQRLLQNVIPAVKMQGEVREILHRLEIANTTNRTANDFVAGLRKDINRLMPEDFVEIYEGERLPDIPRHLRAIMIRAERGIAHLEKDHVKADRLRPFDDKLKEMLKEAASSSEEKKRAVEEYTWMVEEYRISVFAPEIKARGPVSPKKLKEKVADIERMM